MNIHEITLGSAASQADLIDLQESLQSPQANGPGVRWAFRGQSQSYGTLVPSFQRIVGQRRSIGAAEIIERDLDRDISKALRTDRRADCGYAISGFDWAQL